MPMTRAGRDFQQACRPSRPQKPWLWPAVCAPLPLPDATKTAISSPSPPPKKEGRRHGVQGEFIRYSAFDIRWLFSREAHAMNLNNEAHKKAPLLLKWGKSRGEILMRSSKVSREM